MKRIFTTILMAVGITGPLVTHLAAQQSRMVADIPFTFLVDNRALPAGHYDLSQQTISGSVFALRDARGHSIFVPVAVREDGKPNNPSLTFACYGKDCVLAKITPPNSLTAYSLSRETIEKNLHHKLGMSSMVAVKLALR
jgi:hypothetical protein